MTLSRSRTVHFKPDAIVQIDQSDRSSPLGEMRNVAHSEHMHACRFFDDSGQATFLRRTDECDIAGTALPNSRNPANADLLPADLFSLHGFIQNGSEWVFPDYADFE